MEISQKGLDFIKSWEGLELEPYRDAAGLWTVGYGHLIKDDEEFTTLTLVEAEDLLKDDVEWAEDAVNRYVKVDLTQAMFDSLVSFVFNVGANAFKESTLLKWLNKGRKLECPVQFARWTLAGGKRLLGLARRRAAEAVLFLS